MKQQPDISVEGPITPPSNSLDGKKFSQYFFFGLLLFSLTIFIWKRADIFPWIGGCSSAGYSNDTFMSYCHSTRFGDYEHRAYWQQLEPGLIDPIKNADVLFLGNSRTQYAFSTDAIKNHFANNPLSHYVFGFGMGSQNFVVEKMVEKFSLKPKAVIINADPFFTDRISGTNASMLDESAVKQWEYAAKQWLQNRQRAICEDNSQGFISRLLCLGTEETLFRDKQNGHWDVRYFRKNKRIPVAMNESEITSEEMDKAIQIARSFQEKLGLSSKCILLTVTPRTETPITFARTLSVKLGWPGIFPMLENLVTVDDSHLDPDSALRWSEEFIGQADKILRRCSEIQ